MPLNSQEILEVIACVRYYQMMHVSVNSPRYREFQTLLEKLQSLHTTL